MSEVFSILGPFRYQRSNYQIDVAIIPHYTNNANKDFQVIANTKMSILMKRMKQCQEQPIENTKKNLGLFS